MPKKLAVFILIFSLSFQSWSQDFMYIPEDKDSFNMYNSRNQKHGFWLYKAQESLDGFGFSFNEYGYYQQDRRQGLWVKYDGFGRLISIENYKDNVLDGESQYFDKGLLTLRANFRGLNQEQAFDTIYVINPVDLEESEVIISTDIGTTRHGTWKYYNPKSGAIIRVEEYQVDSLISKFDYYISEKEDKESVQKMLNELPHNLPNSKIRQNNRKYRKSLTQ